MSLADMIAQQRAKLQRSNNNRPEKLSSEKNLVRILVGDVGGKTQFSQDWGQHFIKDTAGQLKAVYICTQTNFDEPCPICDALASGTALTSDEDLLKTLKDARSSKRILVNALYLKGGKHDNPDKTPVVLDLPPSVWDSILATAEAFLAEGVNVFDADEGHNFIIEKTGSGMNTEYKVTPSPKGSPVPKEALDKIKDLADWARQVSEADCAKAVTSVRVISGQPGSVSSARPSLSAPARTSRLAEVDADALDADFTEVKGEAGLDDFLAGL